MSDAVTHSPLPPAFLVLPAAGASQLESVKSAVLSSVFKFLISFPVDAYERAVQESLVTARHDLAQTWKERPECVRRALSNPDVLCPLMVMMSGATDQPLQMLDVAIPALMAQLGKDGVFDTIIWERPIARIYDSGRRQLLELSPAGQGLRLTKAGLDLATAEGELTPLHEASACTASQPFHPLADDLPNAVLSLVDSNPLARVEAHPDKDGNAISLGGKAVERWLESMAEALALIRMALPGWYAEAAHAMRRFIPVGYFPEEHLSASYREAPGVVYLSLCDSPLTLAEAIIHETQHGKVNWLSWLDPILHNGHQEWTSSPVRPDERPLWGVLLAVHAFLPVAAMHSRLAELDHPIAAGPDFERRRAEVMALNADALESVSTKGKPSPLGSRLVSEMQRLHEALS